MTTTDTTLERMTPNQAADVLRQHNAWRRDTHDVNHQEMLPPKLIGKAIDVAIAHLTAPEALTQDMIVAGFECDAWDELSSAAVEKKGWPYSCRESAECVTAIYKAMRAAMVGCP